jgi:sulfur carrier protein ThiS
MQIRIKLMGVLKNRTPQGGVLELSEGATIADALAAMELSATPGTVYTVGGNLERDTARVMSAGEELTVLPPVGGG